MFLNALCDCHQRSFLLWKKRESLVPECAFARNPVLIRLPWSDFLGGCHAEVVGRQPCVQHSRNKVYSVNLQLNIKLGLSLLILPEGGANIHMYAIIFRILQ